MGITIRSDQQNASSSCHKPGLNELLRVMGLDVEFHRAGGDLLYYRRPDGRETEVVDLVGGYGTLLLGHNHPALIAEATRFLTSGLPNHTQGARRSGAERLARALSKRAGGEFSVVFGNSGTEAVEAAIKHALLETGGRTLIAMEGAFHGKTIGSLQLTANPVFREPFAFGAVDVARVRPNDVDHLRAVFSGVSDPAGFVVEPVQGEAGVRPLDATFLRQAAELCHQRGIPLIVDECQTGLGRTGEFLASQALGVAPDYIILAKALGGGLAKISALLIRRERYRQQFDLLHSSTFADDEFSSSIALRVLELLDTTMMETCRLRGSEIQQRLDELLQRYPEVLCGVRGRGLLLGVELQRPSPSAGYLLRFLTEQNLLGPLVCAYLLHEHGIRVATTLSDPFTLRIQPSAFITDEHLEQFYTALEDCCRRLQSEDLTRLVRFLASPTAVANGVPRPPGAASSGSPLEFRTSRPCAARPGNHSRTNRVAWLFHLINEDDLVHLEPGLAGLLPLERRTYLERTAPLISPVALEPVAVTSVTGECVQLHPIVLPVTSEWLLNRRSGRGHMAARALIQQGVDTADTLRCSVVTLGQFTSIISRGGRNLCARDLCLTSGNSYTAAVIAQSLNRFLAERGLDRRELTLAIVGAAGDIGRTCAALVAPGFQRSILVGTSNAASYRRLRSLADETPGSEAATDLAQISSADVVIGATNSLSAVLRPDILHPHAIVCDVSVPGMLAATVPTELPGRTILPGAVVSLPGSEELGIPGFPLPAGFTYGCMAEGLLLGLEGICSAQWLGPSHVKRAREAAEFATRHGFRAAECLSIDGQSEDVHASLVSSDT